MRKETYVHSTYFLIGLAAFFYVLVRGFTIGATYDEAWTLGDFVPQNVLNILNYTPCDANNHIINTLLIKLFFLFGNHSMFVARLPNILAFTLFAFYSYKIAYHFLTAFIGICCFILLLANPFLLDFFSLARGYGLSLDFLLPSLYYSIKYVQSTKSSFFIGAISFAALATLSNFSWLNYFMAIVITLTGISFFQKGKYNFKKTILLGSGISLVLLLIIYEPIRKLKINGNLYYGGDKDFYHDTLISLSKYTFYNSEANAFIIDSLNIFLTILILFVLASFLFNRNFFSIKNTVLAITLICILSTVLQHYLFNTLYLIDRTALFFYPLLILILCFSLNQIPFKSFTTISISLVSLAFSINFINHANFYKTALWYFDAHSKEILKTMNDLGEEQNKLIKIDFSWPFGSSFDYYLEKEDYPYLEIVKSSNDREDLNTNADYYIYLDKSLEKVGYDKNYQKILSVAKDTFTQYKNENIIIFRNLRK